MIENQSHKKLTPQTRQGSTIVPPSVGREVIQRKRGRTTVITVVTVSSNKRIVHSGDIEAKVIIVIFVYYFLLDCRQSYNCGIGFMNTFL